MVEGSRLSQSGQVEVGEGRSFRAPRDRITPRGTRQARHHRCAGAARAGRTSDLTDPTEQTHRGAGSKPFRERDEATGHLGIIPESLVVRRFAGRTRSRSPRCGIGASVDKPTGGAVALPPGHEGQIRPRSGIALRHGVTVLNSPGTIDADYRGEIQVILVNLGAETFEIMRGTRIAQMIIAPIVHVRIVESGHLDATGRKGGGFGSTG